MVLQKSNFSSFKILQNDHDGLINFFKLNEVTNRINNVTSAFVSLELSPNFFFVFDKIADICRINKKYERRRFVTSSRQILRHFEDMVFQLRQRIFRFGSSWNRIHLSLESLATMFGSFGSLPLHRFGQHCDDLSITIFFPF